VIESPEALPAWLRVYDTAGRQVYARHRLIKPGRNELQFEGRDATGRRLASGVYFIRMTSPGVSIQKKIVIIR
jgi:hypothetical protein